MRIFLRVPILITDYKYPLLVFSRCSFNPILMEVLTMLYFGHQSIQQLRLEALLSEIMYRDTLYASFTPMYQPSGTF